MSDAAQGELPTHEVFATPFKVEPKYEDWPTPAVYREHPAGKNLPATLKVWRVQNTGKDFGSVVSRGAGFSDSPDAEILTEGYNIGKGPHDAAVSRQGNFLQWGFNGSPKQMTEAGRRFFINCVVYIRKFDGKLPLVRMTAPDRSSAPVYARLIPRITDAKFVEQVFGPGLRGKFKGEPKVYAEELAKYLEANAEFIYCQRGGFEVDEDSENPRSFLQPQDRDLGETHRAVPRPAEGPRRRQDSRTLPRSPIRHSRHRPAMAGRQS